MHGSTLGPGIFAGLGGNHTVRPTWSHHWAATCAGWGTDNGGQKVPTYPNRPSSSQLQQQASLSVFWRKKKSGNPLDRWAKATPCPRLPSNLGLRKKMEIPEVSFAPHLILVHVRWVLGYLPLVKKVQNLHHHNQTPFQCFLTGTRHCLQCKTLDMALSFFFPHFSPPYNHWNRWLFLPRSW